MVKRTWEEIYKFLGLGVDFEVEVTNSFANKFRLRLSEDGPIYADDGENANDWFVELIHGEYEIAPWEPKEGESFWHVHANEPAASYGRWHGTSKELALLALGNVFRTEAEAEAHIPEIHEKYRKIREGKRFE